LCILDNTTTDLNCSTVIAFDTLFTYNASWQSLNVRNYHYEPKFKVFPNTTSNFITIENQSIDQIQSIELLDYAGKHIKIFNPNSTSINLNDLAPGIYLPQISTAQGNFL
jgi:hypothetical protein